MRSQPCGNNPKLTLYRAWERLPLISHVQALRNNDTEQNSTNHLTTHQRTCRFRPGKSCTTQLSNLTHHIEYGYQESIMTGYAFVDQFVACDIVNFIFLIHKLYNTTQDSILCTVIQNLLSNRGFYVELNN